MRLILNDDFAILTDLLAHRNDPSLYTEEAVRDYIRQYKGTQLSAIYFNPNAQFSYTPSRVWETAEDRYQLTEVDGIPVDFKKGYLEVWHQLCTVQGLDIFGIMMEESRSCGISPRLSFRMNDVHDSMTQTGEMRGSRYTHTARQNGLVRCRHHELNGYFDNALDFSLPQVRARLLAYIREQVNRYDTDGVELDFMREPYCFRPGFEDEGRQIVRDLVKEVRQLCQERSEVLGHPILLSVRTFRDPTSDYYSGIHACGLAKEGLLDAVTPTPRWESCDSEMPIDLWRKALPADVQLWAGTDVLYHLKNEPLRYYDYEQLYGMANHFLSAGADCIYLFNHAYRGDWLDPARIESLKIAGSLATLSKVRRRNTVTYQDLAAIGLPCFEPLPLPLSNRYSYLRIGTGRTEGKMFLLLGIDAPAEEVEIYVNSSAVKYCCDLRADMGGSYNDSHPIHTDTSPAPYDQTPMHLYEVAVLRPLTQTVELRLKKGKGTLRFAEMRTYKE